MSFSATTMTVLGVCVIEFQTGHYRSNSFGSGLLYFSAGATGDAFRVRLATRILFPRASRPLGGGRWLSGAFDFSTKPRVPLNRFCS